MGSSFPALAAHARHIDRAGRLSPLEDAFANGALTTSQGAAELGGLDDLDDQISRARHSHSWRRDCLALCSTPRRLLII
jgi:hypothetical protein